MQKCLKKLAPFLLNRLIKRTNMTIRTNSLIKFNKIFFSNIPITASDEKNSEEKINIDYIESGVFEILKNSPKCKQDKLSYT